MLPSVAIITTLIFITVTSNARVIYVDEEPDISYRPFYPERRLIRGPGNAEQASRDLDMTFSAGPSDANNDNIIYPLKKVYMSGNSQPDVEIVRDIDSPVYYKWPEVSSRKMIYSDPFYGEKNPKYVKLNDGHRGEVVLELRVIANNNNE